MAVALGSTDLIVRSSGGTVLALVEVKNRQDMTPDLASRYRRNLLVHGIVDESRYFLLLTQDHGYLWTPSLSGSRDSPPSVQIDAATIVARYLPRAFQNGRLTEGGLTIVVTQWLSDLAAGRYEPDGEPERSLVGSGFLEAMRDAQVIIGDEP